MISYTIGTSGQRLFLTDKVLAHFRRYRQLADDDKEAGGQLFATFRENRIRIERATGPRKGDRRGVTFFIPNRLAERREIKQKFKAGLHYVGDWHTHPEPRPQPSSTDAESIQDVFGKSRHKLASLVMVVVGTAAFPEGLYVGLCTKHRIDTLTPDPRDIGVGGTEESGGVDEGT